MPNNLGHGQSCRATGFAGRNGLQIVHGSDRAGRTGATAFHGCGFDPGVIFLNEISFRHKKISPAAGSQDKPRKSLGPQI
jgi:hypothetical protein